MRFIDSRVSGTRKVALGTLLLLLVSVCLAEPLVLVGHTHGNSVTDRETIAVQILSINDFHGSISQKNEVAGRPAGGAAYLASYLREWEARNPHTLIVHAGDAVGASQAVSSLFLDEPTIEILQFMGFDVGVPGNHEFDRGIRELLRLQYGGRHEATGYFAGSGFPLVLANVVDRKSGDPVFPPYVVKVAGGVPIGFIGVVTTETPSIVRPTGVRNLLLLDPVGCVNRYVRELRSKGVETIIVLAHEGGTQDEETGEVWGPIRDMTEGIDNSVDVVICGHSHNRINGRVDGKLVVQAYSKGTAFAAIELLIDRQRGDVISSDAQIVTVWADVKEPDPRIARLVAHYEEKAMPVIEKIIAIAAHDITRDASPAGESALGNLIADAYRWATGAEIAFVNPGSMRADLETGPVTWGELYEIQPFGNRLVKMTLTGEQIYRLLNQQWQRRGNRLQVRFLQISGIKYVWADGRRLGNKVVRVYLENGDPLDRRKTYTVAANEFLAAGGDNFTVFEEAEEKEIWGGELHALVEYLKSLPQPCGARIEGRIHRLGF